MVVDREGVEVDTYHILIDRSGEKAAEGDRDGALK